MPLARVCLLGSFFLFFLCAAAGPKSSFATLGCPSGPARIITSHILKGPSNLLTSIWNSIWKLTCSKVLSRTNIISIMIFHLHAYCETVALFSHRKNDFPRARKGILIIVVNLLNTVNMLYTVYLHRTHFTCWLFIYACQL